MRRWMLLAAMLATAVSAASAQNNPTNQAVTYRVQFPAPEHHWLEVEATFPGLGAAPLRARMSRSSPGRYAVHEFAKNVFAVDAFDGQGRRLRPTRPDPDEWNVTGHDGTVKIVYRVFGDYADGTYMGVDTTHAHLNMPATFMWAIGLEMRPILVSFAPPASSSWKVATQLFPGPGTLTYTAPNLQYFMDSPTELSDHVVSTFRIPNATGQPSLFRLAAHGDGTQADVDELAKLADRLVREARAVFGEFPVFEPGHYTFLLDFVPWVHDDAMEHRNSTFVSTPGLSVRTAESRRLGLGAMSHEFFHVWNVERIRPAGLEPFDFTRENITCCLWLAEGFTQYYGDLLLVRAGLTAQMSLGFVSEVVNAPGRLVRSAVEMSEHAPFADAGVANDMNDRGRTFISYYSFGAALAVALDLSLREMSAGKLSLDDYMRRLWLTFGKPADPRPGYVARPYTLTDLRTELAGLTGNRAFADAFFDKYIEGREVADYARLLAQAGFVVRQTAPSRAWLGNVDVSEEAGGLLVGAGGAGSSTLVPFGTPLYEAGVDAGDVVVSIDGRPATQASWNALGQKKPGETVSLVVRRRDGRTVTAAVRLNADPRVQVLPLESTGGQPSAAQHAFRQTWLGTKLAATAQAGR